jgi:hypothetical protein
LEESAGLAGRGQRAESRKQNAGRGQRPEGKRSRSRVIVAVRVASSAAGSSVAGSSVAGGSVAGSGAKQAEVLKQNRCTEAQQVALRRQRSEAGGEGSHGQTAGGTRRAAGILCTINRMPSCVSGVRRVARITMHAYWFG